MLFSAGAFAFSDIATDTIVLLRVMLFGLEFLPYPLSKVSETLQALLGM